LRRREFIMLIPARRRLCRSEARQRQSGYAPRNAHEQSEDDTAGAARVTAFRQALADWDGRRAEPEYRVALDRRRLIRVCVSMRPSWCGSHRTSSSPTETPSVAALKQATPNPDCFRCGQRSVARAFIVTWAHPGAISRAFIPRIRWSESRWRMLKQCTRDRPRAIMFNPRQPILTTPPLRSFETVARTRRCS